MALFSRRRRPRRTSPATLHVGDPRFDEWEVVADFGDLQTATAFAERLDELGFEAALTSDWELDEFGRGDVSLRVPGESYGDATAALDGLDLD